MLVHCLPAYPIPRELYNAMPLPTPLDELRARIDQIDQQLVQLINQRAEIVIEVGRNKLQSGAQYMPPTARPPCSPACNA